MKLLLMVETWNALHRLIHCRDVQCLAHIP